MTIQNGSLDMDSVERARILADAQHGVLGSWWQLAVGMSEAAWSFAFGIAQDTRVEVRRRTDATLGFTEEISVGGLRYARTIVDRLDRVVSDVLGRSEATMLVMARTMRRTGHGMADLATNTLSDAIGTSQPQRKNEQTRSYASA